MKSLVIILIAVILNGCILIDVSTNVSLAGEGETWFLYVNEPTSELEFNWHGGGLGNIPNRYRIKIPSSEGEFNFQTIHILKRTSESGYSQILNVTSGDLKIINCVATIDLYINRVASSFNGVYKIPSYACKST